MDKNEVLIIKNFYDLTLFKSNTRKELVIRGLNALSEDKDADFYFFKGEECRIKREYSKAISYYEKTLQIDSGHIDALFYLGLVYYLRDLYAVDTINRLIKVSRQLLKELKREPTVQEIAKNMGVPLKKVRRILELGQKDISFEARAGKVKGNYFVDFIKKDDEDSAIENFRKVIQKNLQHTDAFFFLGWLYNRKGDYEKAIEAYQEVIRVDSNFPLIDIVYNNIGYLYGELEKYPESVNAFKKNIEKNPKDAGAYYGLGWIYNELKYYEKAIEAYKQSILIKPDYAYAHYGLGLIYFAQGYKNAALGEYKILKDLDKNISEDLFNMIYK